MDYKKPMNPEAGPSDTVPAMLTPGEAVIPAPAAQNPANKPAIEAMINEGRIKNDIFDIAESIEAKQIPPLQDLQSQIAAKESEIVTREADEYPELAYKHLIPGLTDHYVTPLQFMAFKAMENFSLQPEFEDKKEKDLSKLEEQKAVLQSQLDKQKEQFELKKEGFKALMDNEKLIQKQNALNKTLGVPEMRTPPSVQGYNDGIPYVGSSYFEPKPDDTPIERSLDVVGRGIGKLGTGLGYFFGEQVPSFFKDVAERQAEAAMLQAQTGSAASTAVENLFRPLDDQKPVPELYEPSQPAQTIQTTQAPPVVEPEESDVDLGISNIITKDQGDSNKKPTTPTKEGGLGSTIAGAFKEMFDPAALTKAAIGYGVTKAMGYDENVAAKQAASQYSLEQKRIEANKAAEAKRAKDLADYEKKKIIDLAYTPGMTPKEARASELAFQERLTKNLKATAKDVNRTTNKKTGNKTDTALYNLGNTEQGYAAEVTNFFRNSGVPIYEPSVQDEMDSIINQSYRDMVAYQKETGNKAGSIVPFMRNKLMRQLAPSANDLLSFENDDGTRTPMNPRISMGLDELISNRARAAVAAENAVDKKTGKPITFDSLNYSQQKAVRAAIFEDMEREFNKVDEATIAAKEGVETPFFVFATKMYK